MPVILLISWIQSYYLVWEFFSCQLDEDTPRCRGGYLSDVDLIDSYGNFDSNKGEVLRSIGEGEEIFIIRRQYGSLYSVGDSSHGDSGSESGSENSFSMVNISTFISMFIYMIIYLIAFIFK
jgi:hypothetical protein